MGTYWDEFLKQYPFVRHCALETTLELFYFYCDSENQDLLKEKIQKVREQFNAPLVSESVFDCPVCGSEWDTDKHNSCKCGAYISKH